MTRPLILTENKSRLAGLIQPRLSILLLVLLAGLVALTGCDGEPDDPEINQTAKLNAVVTGTEATVLRGKVYFLPLTPSYEPASLDQLQLLAGELGQIGISEIAPVCHLQVSRPHSSVGLVQIETGSNNKTTQVWVIEILTEVTVTGDPQLEEKPCSGTIPIRLPGYLDVVQERGYISRIPALDFKIYYFPNAQSRGAARLGNDLGGALLLLLLYLVLSYPNKKSSKSGRAEGCIAILLLISIFYFLRDVYWILQSTEIQTMLAAWLLLHAPDGYGLAQRAIRHKKFLEITSLVICALAVILIIPFFPIIQSFWLPAVGEIWKDLITFISTKSLLSIGIPVCLLILWRVKIQTRAIVLPIARFRVVKLRLPEWVASLFRILYWILVIVTLIATVMVIVVGDHQLADFSPEAMKIGLSESFYSQPFPAYFSDVFPLFVSAITSGGGIVIVVVLLEVILTWARKLILLTGWFRITCPACQKKVTIRVISKGISQCPDCRQFFISRHKMLAEKLVNYGSVVFFFYWLYQTASRPLWKLISKHVSPLIQHQQERLQERSSRQQRWVSIRKTDLTPYTRALFQAAADPAEKSGAGFWEKILSAWFGRQGDFLIPITARFAIQHSKDLYRPDFQSMNRLIDQYLDGTPPASLEGFIPTGSERPLTTLTPTGEIDFHPDSDWANPEQFQKLHVRKEDIEDASQMDTPKGRQAEVTRLAWRAWATNLLLVATLLTCIGLLRSLVLHDRTVLMPALFWAMAQTPALLALTWLTRGGNRIMGKITRVICLLSLGGLLIGAAAAFLNFTAMPSTIRNLLIDSTIGPAKVVAVSALASFLLVNLVIQYLDGKDRKPLPFWLNALAYCLTWIALLVALQAIFGLFAGPVLFFDLIRLIIELLSGVVVVPNAAFAAFLLVTGISWSSGLLIFRLFESFRRTCPACGKTVRLARLSDHTVRCPACTQAYARPGRTGAERVVDFGLVPNAIFKIYQAYYDKTIVNLIGSKEFDDPAKQATRSNVKIILVSLSAVLMMAFTIWLTIHAFTGNILAGQAMLIALLGQVLWVTAAGQYWRAKDKK